LARTSNFDRLWEEFPHAYLTASGRDVGLPEGQMGNSEVGHLNIGMGRVVVQDLPRINEALADGQIASSEALRSAIEALKKTGGTCHLAGLVSPGGVHAHQDHAVALAKLLHEAGIPTSVHVFTDGRDTPPRSALDYLDRFSRELPPSARIKTLTGRFYAMDRDNRWDRVRRAYDVLVDAEGKRFADVRTAIEDAYARGITDEFIEPAIFDSYAGMKDGDGLLWFNFRADRARELLDSLVNPDFTAFPRERKITFSALLGLSSLGGGLDDLMSTLLPSIMLTHSLGEVVSGHGLSQLRMAESEKYPHVTYFLNGGVETPAEGEDRILVPSPAVATYDLQPEMSAPELTEKAVQAIRSGKFSLIVINFANPDMVGHTGDLQATIKAVETVDASLGLIAEAIRETGATMLVTADHGNSETMVDPITGAPHTAHTVNPVPIMLVGEKDERLGDGRLADIAPTLLQLLDIPQPPEMTGESLLR
jgi:2,3-bisphosphoglycerate-independent phosphoglycerate mutase